MKHPYHGNPNLPKLHRRARNALADAPRRANWPARAQHHGLMHDGYQGEGYLDLKLEWRPEAGGTASATVRVTTWLA